MRVPIQYLSAAHDDRCTPALVDRFEDGLRRAGEAFELHRYEAEHAFADAPRASVHDRAATELAWGRATSFLRAHLS